MRGDMYYTDQDPLPAWMRAVVMLAGSAFGLLTLWWLVTAFTGGEMAVIGYYSEGGLGEGLLWMFIVEPIVLAVAGIAARVVLVPLLYVWARATGRA